MGNIIMEDFQSDHPLTYISLFSGIGGFEIGIHSIYPNARCLGYSEIDPNALEVYQEHFPDHPALGDVREIDGRKFRGKVDLLVGGSPCQNFSRLGDRKGLKGKKSQLLLEYIRLLREIDPKFFILENVVMKEEYQDKISKMLGVKPILLNSNIVSPQRRRRLFWCNFDISILGQEEPINKQLSTILLPPKDKRLKDTLWHDAQNPITVMEKVYKAILTNKPNKRKPFFQLAYYTDREIGTVTTGCQNHLCIYMGDMIYRDLHTIEMERLQTFPDNWTESVSSAKARTLLGNAVTCDLIILICSLLKKII